MSSIYGVGNGSAARFEQFLSSEINLARAQENVTLLEKLKNQICQVSNQEGSGTLRFSKDKDLYFSGNRSVRETLHLHDGGGSKAPSRITELGLPIFGKKIKCIAIQKILDERLKHNEEEVIRLQQPKTSLSESSNADITVDKPTVKKPVSTPRSTTLELANSDVGQRATPAPMNNLERSNSDISKKKRPAPEPPPIVR